MPTSPDPFYDTAKAHYCQLFEEMGLVVKTDLKIFLPERSILVKCTDNDLLRLQNTAFSHFRQVNAIELKGINDPLTLIDYNKIMMRAWGLGAFKLEEDEEEELTDSDDALNSYPSKRTLTIICVTLPTKLLDQLETEVGFTKQAEGIYHCPDGFSQWIIHPSELPLVPKNYPLLPLAQGNKLEEFIALCLRENLVNYLQLIMDIGITTDPNVILRKILETKQMNLTLHEDTRHYLNQYFLEMPEEMTKIPTFQDALAISERRAAVRTIRNTLIRQLHRKFAPVPDNVVQKIETANNLEQLDNWLDQIVIADSLADTELIDTKKADKT
ncbi:MAG: hypothetical protein DRR08_09625 [Candidatus Parabeggiatoa sp. nov. 2]|nr:MAG: hypothetical protein B6247_29240 [Beggiatoa sp. 4572_84]RKZ61103.1 MAG: hypothetical protein DRR08_09625 [Gammaproteobacteria bacterium]